MKELEVWRDIKDYEGKYQVSNLGRVKSLAWGKERILKHNVNSGGYLYIILRSNGEQHTYKIHRLVAKAFIPNPDNLPQVNHKDENKENNRVDNLEWCSAKYNTNYGTRGERITEKLTNRKDTSKQVICVETGKIYESTKEVGRQTGINNKNIRHCCNHYTYTYKDGHTKTYQTAGGFHWAWYTEKGSK